MARLPQLAAVRKSDVIVRMAAPESDELRENLFRRYPSKEWATFARFGWREVPSGLILTLAGLEPQLEGDLDPTVSNVAFQEPYTLRTALRAEDHPFALGVCHSHPEDCLPRPSHIDDDMDRYFAEYFADFAPGRPYVSLIAARVDGEFAVAGRVRWRGDWLLVTRFAIERVPLRTWLGGARPAADAAVRPRTARLAAAFGEEAEAHLRRATVAVIGAGGTGSAAIEILARAGVGRLIIIDPDALADSNLERVHGSEPNQAREEIAKVAVARDHVRRIDPTCKVTTIRGALPQPVVVDAVVQADVALGCTDQQHSRLALSDLAFRYLVPSIDCGVVLEGNAGRVTGQVVQLVRFLAADPCALCREMTDPRRLAQELMSEEERHQRQAAAAAAAERGEDPDPYWRGMPQLNTVGYLTTTAGAIAAGYAIGWLTGRFDPPFGRVQLNFVGRFLDVADADGDSRPDCSCHRARGWADQGAAEALITAPEHWPRAVEL